MTLLGQKGVFMKRFVAIVILAGISLLGYSGNYFTKTGHIWFFSSAPLEDIEAHNRQVTSIIKTETGEMVFKVLMKGFQFEKALMQEHFNEKYVESDLYPESTFKGRIVNISELDFESEGTYKVQVEGDLLIHGVTKPVNAQGTLEVKENKILGKCTFQVAVADYEIKIPGAVKDNIAEVIDIHVDMEYEPLN